MLRRHGWILIAFALLAVAWLQWGPGAGNAPVISAPGEQHQRSGMPHDGSHADRRADEQRRAHDQSARRSADTLPREAHDTLRLIHAGGPFPHRQDGGIFGNRERELPHRARGWYREYSVRTPGLNHRGARRIVTGGGSPGKRAPSEFWYTDDHYRSFRRINGATGSL